MIWRRKTLGRYIAGRFTIAILGAFLMCATLIMMIDLVELLRISGRNDNVGAATITLLALLRLPSHVEILLPFCVLVGSGAALINLNRKSELAVMRAAGMSAWQFVRPGLLVALLLGVFSTIGFNPLAAHTRAEADEIFAEVFGRGALPLASTASGAWLRQDGADGSSVLHAASASRDGRTVMRPIFLHFDADGRFVERIEGDRASLRDGYWEVEKARTARAGREPEQFDTYTVSTYLTPERIADALGNAISMSIWELPGLIEVTERAGLSAARFHVQLEMLLSRPILLAVMVLLAASVSLRSFRSGRLQTMVAAGAIGGLGFFLISEVSRQIGVAGLAPPSMAVWAPIVVACFGSLTVLLRQEDG